MEVSKPLNDMGSIFDTESSERMQKILDSNVGQIKKVKYLFTQVNQTKHSTILETENLRFDELL